MLNVYLINVGFDIAGTERRFANIWRILRSRGNVRPILVIPDTMLAGLLKAGLIESANDPDIWAVNEPTPVRASFKKWKNLKEITIAGALRTRMIVPRFHGLCKKIEADKNSVAHIGLPCGPLVPPNVPLVYECVDSTLEGLGRRHFQRAATRASIIHCQTNRIRVALELAVTVSDPKWKTITSPSYFAQYGEETPSRLRDPSLVIFVGRLSSEKSPILFLEGLAEARKKGAVVRGLILGQGPMLQEVQLKIKELALESCVSIDFVGDPLEHLSRAAIFASLQIGDNYGSQSLLEAMGAGCAINATDVGDTFRLVDESVGIRIRQDKHSLADAIVNLVRDPVRTKKLGAAASQRSRTDYSADTHVAYLETLYEDSVSIHHALGNLYHPDST